MKTPFHVLVVVGLMTPYASWLGLTLGLALADILGDRDGLPLGDKLGDTLGDTLGDLDGLPLGDKLGDTDGDKLADSPISQSSYMVGV